jgi:transcriptional regulator with XRE-family HTH domain
MKTRPKKNIVGPLVRALRNQLGWSQEQATAHCNIAGLDISRATYAQIEMQIRNVTDLELALLARSFRVRVEKLLPEELPIWVGKGKKDTWKNRIKAGRNPQS